ncbi:hypothetical protein RC1_2643 [Rhodospirillum centenum SW]|uniref:Uncharacterized protein n=1 Tax=Rhodospirillum centenum (strain ATCC 51521 / SW) TaxID=414684 RepID=B6IUT6_RHOCS|nr:hypothetical protein RC1_2643 [Rhodospirillum centenum SW]
MLHAYGATRPRRCPVGHRTHRPCCTDWHLRPGSCLRPVPHVARPVS